MKRVRVREVDEGNKKEESMGIVAIFKNTTGDGVRRQGRR